MKLRDFFSLLDGYCYIRVFLVDQYPNCLFHGVVLDCVRNGSLMAQISSLTVASVSVSVNYDLNIRVC